VRSRSDCMSFPEEADSPSMSRRGRTYGRPFSPWPQRVTRERMQNANRDQPVEHGQSHDNDDYEANYRYRYPKGRGHTQLSPDVVVQINNPFLAPMGRASDDFDLPALRRQEWMGDYGLCRRNPNTGCSWRYSPRAASSAPSAMCATTSLRPESSPTSTTSMSRPRLGAAAWRRIGAAPDKTSSASARPLPRRRPGCWRCRTTPIR
jgi:hypothetical protein